MGRPLLGCGVNRGVRAASAMMNASGRRFRLARVQVSVPAHRQPGQASDGDTDGVDNRDGERPRSSRARQPRAEYGRACPGS